MGPYFYSARSASLTTSPRLLVCQPWDSFGAFTGWHDGELFSFRKANPLAFLEPSGILPRYIKISTQDGGLQEQLVVAGEIPWMHMAIRVADGRAVLLKGSLSLSSNCGLFQA